MYSDLHLHSLLSDGKHSPEIVVRLAYSKGVSILALTDHDTLLGIDEARTTSQKLGITFINGIELEADIDIHHYCHILAYNIKDFNTLNLYLDTLRNERIQYIESYIKKLRALGYAIDLESVDNLSPGRHLTAGHIAQWLLKNGNGNDRLLQQANLLNDSCIPRKYHFYKEILQLIEKCGGISILAHPFRLRYTNPQILEKLIADMKNFGLKGIEAYYGTHNYNQIEACIQFAQKYDLIMTGGSDWHGWEDLAPIGVNIPDNILQTFLNRIVANS